MRIMVVDDELTGRLMLERALVRDGHEVSLAVNGREAIEVFTREDPDLVLMDAQMPVLSGYEATAEIKRLAGDRFVPVVFVTGNESEQDLVRCVECGGDDFITKPFSMVILRAKMEALERLRGLQESLQERNRELREHRQNLIHEQEVAQRVFEKIVHTGDLDAGNMKYLISSMAIFNGDLILAARRPEAGQNILVGDFTGHGLPAAIGAIPVARTFYAMTGRGFPMTRILSELNDQLCEMLPTEVFLAAVGIQVDDQEGRIGVWNGGIPDVILRTRTGECRKIGSSHLPLGLVRSDSLRVSLDSIDVSDGDRVYVYTDGVIEMKNGNGEQFGEKRLFELISDVTDADEPVSVIDQALAEFRGDLEQSDDVTLLELTFIPGFTATMAPAVDRKRPAFKWDMEFSVQDRSLCTFDPLPHLVKLITEVQGLTGSRQQLQTILAELYANALDHGVLELDSSMKHSAEGFARYYSERDSRLRQLTSGSIRLRLAHEPREEGGGRLWIDIVDSGQGFDHSAVHARQASETGPSALHGRGLRLVESLCRKVEFLDRGNRVRACYEWV